MDRSLGYRPSVPDKRDAAFRYFLPKEFLAAIPAQASVKDLLPTAYDQGMLGSCVAQATKALMAYCYTKQDMLDPDLASLMLYYLARELDGDVYNDVGCTPRNALKAANKTGVCREELWPYQIERFADRPAEGCYQDAAQFMISSYHAMPQTLSMLRGCIAEGFPFSVGIFIHENFPLDSATGDIPMPAGEPLGGHDIAIVWYDDYTRRFGVRNSWPDWGVDGYGSIPYEYLLNPMYAQDHWTVRLVNPLNPGAGMPVALSKGCLAELLKMFGGVA